MVRESPPPRRPDSLRKWKSTMQEKNLRNVNSQRPTVIEVGGEPLGVVVPAEGGYRFLAVKLPAFAVDGQHFPSIETAHIAVSQAVKDADAA